MEKDIRLLISFKGHRKRVKLQKRIGADGVLGLIDLWLTAAEDAPDGRLRGWDEEDIAIAGGWTGEPGVFVDALVKCCFLEKSDGDYRLHDWEDHQGWTVGSKDRRIYSRIAALIKRYGREVGLEKAKTIHGIDISAFGYPECDAAGMPPAGYRHATGTQPAESRHASSVPNGCRRDAPSPSPSPSRRVNKKSSAGTPKNDPDPPTKKPPSAPLARTLSKDDIKTAAVPMVEKEIFDLCEQLQQKGIFIKAHSFANFMLKRQQNPRAILHSLTRCYLKVQSAPFDDNSKSPWAYCAKVMSVENGNFNEHDHHKDSPAPSR